MAKTVVKKRSTIRDKSMLTPPAEFDSKKYAGRWVAEQRLNARSDGFEARGFIPYKTKEGNIVKVGDLVWCYMTREDAVAYKQELQEAARDQILNTQNQVEEENSRLAFEVERAGGKVETKVTFE